MLTHFTLLLYKHLCKTTRPDDLTSGFTLTHFYSTNDLLHLQTRVILNSGLSPWLTDALCRAPSLQYVSLDEHYLAYDQADHSQSLYGRGWSGNLARISRNPAFRAVLCRAKDPTLKQGKYQVPQYPVVLLDGAFRP